MEAVEDALKAAVSGKGVAAVSVIPGRGERPHSYWLPECRDEPAFLIYSITKTFVATVALRLVEEGVLSLGDALARWFPEIDQAEHISLGQLLNHTAGIVDYGSLRHYHDEVRSSPSKPWHFDDFARETYGKGLAHPPGKGWLYSNPGYMLVREILQLASGRSLRELVATLVAGPLELHRTAVVETVFDLRALARAPSTLLSVDRTPVETREHYHPGWVAHGLIASTATDVAMFFDALFGGRLLSSGSLDAMKTLVPLPESIAQNLPGEPGYGLGLMGGTRAGIDLYWGHGGGGPGYQAGAFHRADTGRTVCVLSGIEDGFSAQELALEILAAELAQAGTSSS